METKYYSTLFPILCMEKKRSLTNNDVIPCSIFKMISCQKLHFMELQYRKNTKPHYLYGHHACYDKLTSRKSTEFLSARILRGFKILCIHSFLVAMLAFGCNVQAFLAVACGPSGPEASGILVP